MENEPCLPSQDKPPALKKVSGPDGLEAWCVALAACFINFVMAGLGRMSGLLFVAFIDIFQADRGQAAIPFSVRSSMRNLLGPAVGILGQKYSVRTVTLLGGIIGSVSAACCFFAEDITWVTIIWGGLNGVGTSLTTTLPQVVIGQYFVKYHTTAAGMAFSGGCVGSFLFPALLEYLLHTYGLSGTFLIIAGIIMHVIPAAMILRRPSWIRCPRKKDHDVKTLEDQETDKPPVDVIASENEHSRADDASPDVEFLKTNVDLVTKVVCGEFLGSQFADGDDVSTSALMEGLEEMYCLAELRKNLSCTSSLVATADQPEPTDEVNAKKDIDKSCVSKDKALLAYLHLTKILGKYSEKEPDAVPVDTNGLRVVRELGKLCNLYEQMNTHEVLLDSQKVVFEEKKDCVTEKSQERTNTFLDHVKASFRLHTNPLFLLICMCRACHFLTFVTAVTVIVDFVIDKGLTMEDGKYVIAALSFGDLVGRLGLGWVTDNGYIILPRYMLIFMVLQGISTSSLPFSSANVAMLYIGITLFGLLQGSLFVRHPVLISRYMNSNEQSIAMGCMNFCSGLLGFALPVYIGFFRDVIGSYDGIFFINGAIGLCVGLLWLFEPYFLRCIAAKEQLKKDLISNV